MPDNVRGTFSGHAKLDGLYSRVWKIEKEKGGEFGTKLVFMGYNGKESDKESAYEYDIIGKLCRNFSERI